jgi:hypothetical protein
MSAAVDLRVQDYRSDLRDLDERLTKHIWSQPIEKRGVAADGLLAIRKARELADAVSDLQDQVRRLKAEAKS